MRKRQTNLHQKATPTPDKQAFMGPLKKDRPHTLGPSFEVVLATAPLGVEDPWIAALF
jgi:hypothetical protein